MKKYRLVGFLQSQLKTGVPTRYALQEEIQHENFCVKLCEITENDNSSSVETVPSFYSGSEADAREYGKKLNEAILYPVLYCEDFLMKAHWPKIVG
jgi:hypothetical protein